MADIEALRIKLGIERWLVIGGSWGSTLALAYAEQHPSQVTALVLRGIFLLRRWEVDWFYQNPNGAASIFPDLWEQYVAPIPETERHDMVRAYYRRLTSPNPEAMAQFKETAYATALARIECHYFLHRGFFRRDGQLLRDIAKIRRIPSVIVQGRYDMVCPMRSAWDLHKEWPKSELRIVDDAGHSAFEPGVARELVRATDAFATR